MGDIAHFSKYDANHGFRVKVNALNGLPVSFEDKFIQCFVEVIDFMNPQSKLCNERFFTQNVDMKSNQRFPSWFDKASCQFMAKKCTTSLILVQVYSLQQDFTPSWEKEPKGNLKVRYKPIIMKSNLFN